MKELTSLTSRAVPLRADNVDTDQIIPASYLTTVSRAGLGKGLFHAWRYHLDGTDVDSFVLNQPQHKGAEILIAGANFGSGSSREHAVWALADFGFRAVIAPSFADIFTSNSLNNGLLVVSLPADQVESLFCSSESDPQATITIDLESQTVTSPSGETHPFAIDPFRKHCILKGLDDLGYLLDRADSITAFEKARTEMAAR